ncbi:hypothetical protein J1605_005103 [Eschrichtius robustus]|uniref:Uncharacterized protein n=1 Tax=Eschrichtius robustus TaxID=9764 RepID=A0AB34H7V9_ESCRO|nr:hypothetical protein J1605_005103 [Eschrichtius robustus]
MGGTAENAGRPGGFLKRSVNQAEDRMTTAPGHSPRQTAEALAFVGKRCLTTECNFAFKRLKIQPEDASWIQCLESDETRSGLGGVSARGQALGEASQLPIVGLAAVSRTGLSQLRIRWPCCSPRSKTRKEVPSGPASPQALLPEEVAPQAAQLAANSCFRCCQELVLSGGAGWGVVLGADRSQD